MMSIDMMKYQDILGDHYQYKTCKVYMSDFGSSRQKTKYYSL